MQLHKLVLHREILAPRVVVERREVYLAEVVQQRRVRHKRCRCLDLVLAAEVDELGYLVEEAGFPAHYPPTDRLGNESGPRAVPIEVGGEASKQHLGKVAVAHAAVNLDELRERLAEVEDYLVGYRVQPHIFDVFHHAVVYAGDIAPSRGYLLGQEVQILRVERGQRHDEVGVYRVVGGLVRRVEHRLDIFQQLILRDKTASELKRVVGKHRLRKLRLSVFPRALHLCFVDEVRRLHDVAYRVGGQLAAAEPMRYDAYHLLVQRPHIAVPRQPGRGFADAGVGEHAHREADALQLFAPVGEGAEVEVRGRAENVALRRLVKLVEVLEIAGRLGEAVAHSHGESGHVLVVETGQHIPQTVARHSELVEHAYQVLAHSASTGASEQRLENLVCERHVYRRGTFGKLVGKLLERRERLRVLSEQVVEGGEEVLGQKQGVLAGELAQDAAVAARVFKLAHAPAVVQISLLIVLQGLSLPSNSMVLKNYLL